MRIYLGFFGLWLRILLVIFAVIFLRNFHLGGLARRIIVLLALRLGVRPFGLLLVRIFGFGGRAITRLRIVDWRLDSLGLHLFLS